MTSNEAVQAGPTIPDTMRAAVLRDHDKGLEIETIRTSRLKAGEVLIKVAACGLCYFDLHVIGGAIAFPLPAVLGHEVTVAFDFQGSQDLVTALDGGLLADVLATVNNSTMTDAANKGLVGEQTESL